MPTNSLPALIVGYAIYDGDETFSVKKRFRFFDPDSNLIARVSLDSKADYDLPKVLTQLWLHSAMLEELVRIVEVEKAGSFDFYEGRLKIAMLYEYLGSV